MTRQTARSGEAEIETPRLRIIRFTLQQLTLRYVAWLNDPLVVQYSEQRHSKHTIESCRQYMESFEGTPHFFWAILLKGPQGEHIGNINAYVDRPNSVADVGILIGEKSRWGRGYGLESWMGVCDYLLRVRGIRKVTAGTIAANEAMRAIMRKAGMVDDGARARQYLWGHQEVDAVYAALFREEWLARHPNGPFEEEQTR